MIGIHHSKDFDGWCSGAILLKKFPEIELIGWDYGDPIPDIERMRGQNVIMIDISFPMDKMLEMARITERTIWIDHHISANKDFMQSCLENPDLGKIIYVYEDGIAACEIGWKYFYPAHHIPFAVQLLSMYDTWRHDRVHDWEQEILPFQFYMRAMSNCPQNFPHHMLDGSFGWDEIEKCIHTGKAILKYVEAQDTINSTKYTFEADFMGKKAICLNTTAFSSNTVQSVYDPSVHDLMLGFHFNGRHWAVSLRSAKQDVDVSVLAKQRGGGGHKAAAGFEAKTFEDIFKQTT